MDKRWALLEVGAPPADGACHLARADRYLARPGFESPIGRIHLEHAGKSHCDRSAGSHPNARSNPDTAHRAQRHQGGEHRQRFAELEQERDEVQVASISTGQLFAAGITSFEIRLSFVGAIAAFHLFSKSFLKTWRNDAIHWFVSTIERKHAFADLVDFTLLLLLIFWGLSILTFVATFSRFRLERLGHLALIEHGLITRRWRAVLLPRVQAVTFVETPVQEWRQAGSLRIELAGSHQRSLDRKMLLPSLPRERALETLERLFGGAFFENISHQLDQFQRLPATSKRMYSMFWVYRIIGLTIALVVLDWASPDIRFEHLMILGLLLLAIPGYFYGRRQFSDAGWLLNSDRELIVRERHVNRRTIICPADRLQWRGMKQMMLPGRKPGAATVVGYVAASGKVDGVGQGIRSGWLAGVRRAPAHPRYFGGRRDGPARSHGSLDGRAALPPACGVVQCCSSIAGPEHARRVGHAGLKPRR